MLALIPVLVFTLQTWAAETPKPETSLMKLVQLAEQNSPTIRKSLFALEQARAELKTARSKFLPSLDFESTHGSKGKDPPNAGDKANAWQSSMALKLTETFYDNGASITNYKIALSSLEQRTLEYELARDNQLLALVNTYYDWSSAWQDRQISDGKRILLKRQFDILEAQYKQGLKTKRDVLRIETEVRRLQIDLLHRDNDLENLLERLCAQAGIDREALKKDNISAEEARPDSPIPSGPWAQLAYSEHRQAKLYAQQSLEAQLKTRLVEREYWPRLALTTEVSANEAGYMGNGFGWDRTSYWGWSGLLTLNYNLWDWGTRSRNLQIARINEGKVQSGNRQNQFDLNVNLKDVWLRLTEFAESAKLTKDLLGIEQQSFNVLEADYRNGRAQYLDLITNLNSLIDARSKFALTFFALKKQQATYSFHKGTLYEDLKPK